LMESFYRGLAQGESKAAALRRAQREYLDGPYAHPYYWAPFYLVGEDGPVDQDQAVSCVSLTHPEKRSENTLIQSSVEFRTQEERPCICVVAN
jgi:hypothetical protein